MGLLWSLEHFNFVLFDFISTGFFFFYFLIKIRISFLSFCLLSVVFEFCDSYWAIRLSDVVLVRWSACITLCVVPARCFVVSRPPLYLSYLSIRSPHISLMVALEIPCIELLEIPCIELLICRYSQVRFVLFSLYSNSWSANLLFSKLHASSNKSSISRIINTTFNGVVAGIVW